MGQQQVSSPVAPASRRPKPPPPDSGWLTQGRAPEARIEQRGRFHYLVYVVHGAMRYGPDGYGWHVFGSYAKAGKKARKVLAGYLKDNSPKTVGTVSVRDLEVGR